MKLPFSVENPKWAVSLIDMDCIDFNFAFWMILPDKEIELKVV